MSKESLGETATQVLVNLEQKSDEELRQILDQLYAEEKEISYRRRLLHGKIDILRSELKERLKKRHQKGESLITGKDLKKLAEILAKGFD